MLRLVHLKRRLTMLINRGYVFRMYPSNEQKTIINKMIGCTCFVYNHYLEEKIKDIKKLSILKASLIAVKI